MDKMKKRCEMKKREKETNLSALSAKFALTVNIKYYIPVFSFILDFIACK